jgi:endonuclease YncB( thermonuclease family)
MGKGPFRRGSPLAAAYVRACDGDTIIVSWIEEPESWPETDRIRLAGIDAPENWPTRTTPGTASAQALDLICRGAWLRIIPTRSWPDPYGRMVAQVFARGWNLSEFMIKHGYAQPFHAPFRKSTLVRKKGLRPACATPKIKLITPPGNTTLPSSNT